MSLRVENDHGVVRVTLDRPDVRNAFDDELIAKITEAFRELPDDARVVVLAGEGKVFCAGADLNWMRSMRDYTLDQNVADSTRLREMFEAVDGCRVPVVARVHGACMAGGTGLVACSDVAVAATGTVFSFTEVRLGLVPAVISPFVVRKTGYAFARAAFLSAERFDAERAHQSGLVHRVVPPEELDSCVDDYVQAFRTAGPGALSRTRELLEQVHGRRPDEVADLTVRTIAEARVSDEGQEGVAAFFEKRPPRWVE